jgi:uncharacterized damage-inducible protein DinB
MPDRRTPFNLSDEKQMLVEFLDYLRESVILKLDGIDDETARRPGVSSGTSLMWLVKHLSRVERAWFHYAFAGGDPDDIGDDTVTEDDTANAVIDDYRATIEESNKIISDCSDLNSLSRHRASAPEPMSMRWLLVHMVEETARHAGHADILREQIDGIVGR